MTDTEKFWDTNQRSFLHDYLKHLATLSLGSIVVLVTFLERFSQGGEWLLLFAIALVGFLFSVLGCLAIQTADVFDPAHESDSLSALAVVGMMAAWIGFVIGIICLVVFSLVNLF